MLVGLVLVAVVAAATGWARVADTRQQLAAARDDVAAAAQQAAALEARVEELEAEAAEGGTGEGGLGGLEDLLGQLGELGGLGGLGDLGELGDLLGGLEGLEGLEGLGGAAGGGQPGAACLAQDPGALLGGGDSVSLDTPPQQLVDEIAGQVSALRDLEGDGDVDVAFLDQQELRARIEQIVDEDYPVREAERDARLLGALGAVPDGTDLRALTTELLGDQVAGFYDPDTGELVVRADAELGPVEAVTVAHELDHALTDAALGLPALDGPGFEGDGDGVLAAQAVVEGDATLLMQQWSLQHLGIEDQLAIAADPSAAAAQADLADVPPFLVEELQFPYLAGLELACAAWQEGGWGAVDATYDELPATTAQVLDPSHPGVVGEALRVAPPGARWEPTPASTLGAAPLSWLLAAPDGDPGRADAAAVADVVDAWGGDRVRLWQDGAASLVALSLVDTGDAPRPLCDLLRDGWLAPAFGAAGGAQDADGVTVLGGDGEVAALGCAGTDVVVAIGPDRRAAVATVRGALP